MRNHHFISPREASRFLRLDEGNFVIPPPDCLDEYHATTSHWSSSASVLQVELAKGPKP